MGFALDPLEWFPQRDLRVHKGLCGRVAVVAGSLSMLGAAVLAAKAALRCGAGMVYVLTIPEALPLINVVHPELIVLPLPVFKGEVSRNAFDVFEEYADSYAFDAVAFGPGMGRSEGTQAFIRQSVHWFAEHRSLFSVLDGDALFAFSPYQAHGTLPKNFSVLTPHAREFERLFGVVVPDKDEARIQAAQEAAKHIHQVVVLKGHHSVIADSDQSRLNFTGNPGMATAGSGDVLTGIILALLGMGLSPFQGAVLGVHLHGLAGDKAYERKGIGLIASDLIAVLPEVLPRQSH